MRITENVKRFNPSQLQALDTARNLAVRANAGSGKTSVVVERLVQLLAKSWDDRPLLHVTSVAAITFTRKAAAELQERLADSFDQLSQTTNDAAERAYWNFQKEELPRAMVGTIDSLCARILREHGGEIIDPDFEPLQGYEEAVFKREAINQVINRLSSQPATGTDAEEVSQVEACDWWALEEGYDALVYHLQTLLNHALDPETMIAAHRGLPAAAVRVEVEWAAMPIAQRLRQDRHLLLRQLRELDREIAGLKNPSGKVRELRGVIREALAGLHAGNSRSDQQALQLLADILLTEKRKGTPRKQGFNAVADHLGPLQENWCPLLHGFDFDYDAEIRAREAADRLVALLAPVHDRYRRLCQRVNRFDFLTLARRTRDLLKTHPDVCADLKRRWRYVMIDEFQDTNELQWEILSWLVGSGPDRPLDEDRLFVVGDPQQSIYRFRHADVGVFRRVQEQIRTANQQHGHAERPTLYDEWKQRTTSDAAQRLGLMPLAENYRSLSPMPLELMDRVFRHVFDPASHGLDLDRNAFEVRYQPLEAGRKTTAAAGEVRYLVPQEQEEEAEDEDADRPEGAPLRENLGPAQVRVLVEELVSLYGQGKFTAEPGEPQNLSWNDMAVLLPSRDTILAELEKEFRRRGVPFIVTSGIGFWQRQEIRDVINLAVCLADGGDELALFALLRSPLGQLGDTEILFLSQLRPGSLMRGLHCVRGDGLEVPAAERGDLWDARVPDTVWDKFSVPTQQRLRRAATRLGIRPPGSWRRRVDRMAHADLLQRCLEESGAYAIYAADAEGELMLANLERLFELVRGEEERSAPGLARLARWLREQMNDSLNEEQATLAPGGEAVQIMTVHAAKGLEFPVVAVMKMERKIDQGPRARLLVKNVGERLLPDDAALVAEPKAGTVAVKVRHPVRPRELYTPRLLGALQRLDQAQQVAESRRLFYVAATRAKERLLLVGRQPKVPGRLFESWQKWFEEALGISPEHLGQPLWQDTARGHAVQIVTGLAAAEPIVATKRPMPDTPLALDYVHERPRTRLIATTCLEAMRQTWHKEPWEWWLKYRAHLDAHVKRPSNGRSEPESAGADLGTAIGTLVHRLCEVPHALREHNPEGIRKLLEAMAAGVLRSPVALDGPPEEENVVGADPQIIRVVAAAAERIWLRLHADERNDVRRLLEAPGETEVPFILKLGRWQISGRYDKLLATDGGFEIVDWKTDKDDQVEVIAQRHEAQMRLYALALHRAGLAALGEGKIRVHLALLHPMVVKPFYFSAADLETFAEELAQELHQMDDYEPDGR